jgi:hypothetical protein
MTSPWIAAAAFAASSALALVACSVDETVEPVHDTAGSARALGMFSSELPTDPVEQAYRALAQDAWLREHRFLDAAKPGHLFDSTRATPAELASGAWSADEIFQIGAQLFHHRFRREEGFGAGDLPHTSRFHTGRRGGPDAERCASCHWRGGIAGAGDGADNAYLDGDGRSQSTTLVRNPISLAGAGLLEILAREMTEELDRAVQIARGQAVASATPIMVELRAKGVSYGTVVVHPTGSIDTSGASGIEPDLVVRPFGWKGTISNLRDAVEDALLLHHGMQSSYLASTAPSSRVGPWGGVDPDGDGVSDEITEGQVSVLTLFIAMQELPQIQPTPHPLVSSTTWPTGQALFQKVGCASCHTPWLPLDTTVYALPGRSGDPDLHIDLATLGAVPRIEPSVETGAYRLYLFSDLKRHDMGAALADSRDDGGVGARMFLTRPLWGVVRSGPYLHDGRAPTLRDAILLHGGEAQAARDAYAALSVEEQGAIDVYLASMTRAPRISRLP